MSKNQIMAKQDKKERLKAFVQQQTSEAIELDKGQSVQQEACNFISDF